MLQLLNQLFPVLKLMIISSFSTAETASTGDDTPKYKANNFDPLAFDQLSVEKKQEIRQEEAEKEVEKDEEAKKVIKETKKEVGVEKQKVSLNEKVKLLSKQDISALTKVINRKSPKKDIMAAQKTLLKLGYDISFINKKREKIEWESAVDWFAETAFSNAIKQLQNDLNIIQSWQLDAKTVKSFDQLSKRSIKSAQFWWKKPFHQTEIKTSEKETNEQVDKTRQSVKDFKESLELTQKLNENLSEYLFREDSWAAIEALVRKISGNDKFSKLNNKNILTTKEKYIKLLKIPGYKEKVENAVKFLTWYNEWVEGVIWSENRESDEIFNNVLKVLPWLFGIYLWDIPLSFMEKIVPWVHIDKVLVFKDWIEDSEKEDWTQKEFEEYYKDYEKKDINVLKNQYSLRSKLSWLKEFKTKDWKKLLLSNLKSLDKETKDLIITYIASRLIPDLRILHRGSFNPFERWDWYTLWWLFGIFKDVKAEKSDILIKKLSDMEVKWLSDLSIADKVLDILENEGDVSVNNVRENNDYIKEVKSENERIAKMRELTSLGFDYLNILYKFENKGIVKNLWMKKSDKMSINKLDKILSKTPISKEELETFELDNKSAVDFIKAIWNPEKMSEYLITTIPLVEGLDYKNVGSSKHGVKLTWDNEKDFILATKNTPDKDSKISSLGKAYNSFIKKAGILWIGYPEFEFAFKHKERVLIDAEEIKDVLLINTWKEDDQETLTDASKIGSKELFKLAPINKNYNYYTEGWELVSAEVKFNLYIRPECINPIIVPNSINGRKIIGITDDWKGFILEGNIGWVIPWFDTSSIPEGGEKKWEHIMEANGFKYHLNTTTTVDGSFPVFIPWTMLGWWGGGWNWGWNVHTRPGETWTVWTGSWGTTVIWGSWTGSTTIWFMP